MAVADWVTARPIAHRGLHDPAAGRIENTLAAFEAAIAHGFAVECDLQLTGDGHVVVFHDDVLDRLGEATGGVAAKTLGEIRKVRLLGTRDGIPTFPELLETIAGRVPLFVEIKRQPMSDRRLEAETAKALARYRGPAALMSFDPGSVETLRRLAPQRPRGLVAGRFHGDRNASRIRQFALRNLVWAPLVGAQFVAYQVHGLTDVAPRLARRLGLPVLAWTVHGEAEKRAALRHADQIIFEGFDPAAGIHDRTERQSPPPLLHA